MSRPPGQPGECWYGSVRKVKEWDDTEGEYVTRTETTGLTYPAVLDTNGDLWIWRDSETSEPGWVKANGYASRFTPGPEWQARCDHVHALPHMTCTSEAECDRQATADDRQSRAEAADR